MSADDEAEPAQRGPPRRCRAKRLSALHSQQKASVKRRRAWLQTARGDKDKPVTQCLSLPPWYHAELDELSHLDSTPVHAVLAVWQKEKTLVAWFTAVLKFHVYKVNDAAPARLILQQTMAAASSAAQLASELLVPGPAAGSDHALLDAADRSERAAATTEVGAASASAGQQDDDSNSDWEQEYVTAVRAGWTAESVDTQHISSYSCRNIMPDRLYLELIKVLLNPGPAGRLGELAAAAESDPGSQALHKLVRRQLHEHGRYFLFWAHVDVSTAERPEIRHARIIPALFRVGADCQRDDVTLQDCRRCVPLSQVGTLLDSQHSGGAHLKDCHRTISDLYSGVPRKAVRLFAIHCNVCNRHDVRERNKKPPRAITVQYVRQRYTLDLIDMDSWQRTSTGLGQTNRYVAHMIDASSKLRWAVAIKKKTAAAVLEVVRHVFTQFGHPALLHTDNGTEFANKQLEQECRLWGTYMVHGRPYHPQSQGVIENPNGVLKRLMYRWRSSHPEHTDWTFVLSQVVSLLNFEHVHSVTGMKPAAHFQQLNVFSRVTQPLRPDERVVITAAEAAANVRLAWVAPCEVLPYDHAVDDTVDGHYTEDSDDVSGMARVTVTTPTATGADTVSAGFTLSTVSASSSPLSQPAQPATAAATTPTATPAAAARPSTRRPLPAAAAVASARPTRRAAAVRKAARPKGAASLSVPSHYDSEQMQLLQPGQYGDFEGDEWDRDLLPQVRQQLQRQGTIANGDCGPAAGYGVCQGSVASEQQAAQLRRDVLVWSDTTSGQLYYLNHSTAELRQVPPALPDMQGLWRRDRAWVTPDFFTVLGGMVQRNIFLLVRTISQHNGTVNCGIRLLTNGGTLIKTEREDMGCVFFQVQLPHQTGHFEVVCDRSGRARWAADDPAVECLWACMLKIKVDRSVRDMRQKMLTAAANRINTANETFLQGDCAWLTVPAAIVERVTNKLKRKREKIAAFAGKMLVRILSMHTVNIGDDSAQVPAQHFAVYACSGQLEHTVPINELQRCYPPPESSLYRVVELDLTSMIQRERRVKLVIAYENYCRLLAQREHALQVAAAAGVGQVVRSVAESAGSLQGSNSGMVQSEIPPSVHSSSEQAVQPASQPLSRQHAAGSFSTAASSSTESSGSRLRPRIAAGKGAAAGSEVDLTQDSVVSALEPVLYPCTLCGVTLSPAEYVFCMYPACLAPLHKPGAGCTRWDRAVVVDSQLIYCRQPCASLDLSGGAASASNALPEPAEASPPPAVTVAASSARAAASSEHSTAVAAATRSTAPVCSSCLLPVEWSPGASCSTCLAYHHKIPRGEHGCTRSGWSKEGSRKVQGMIQCVACRYKDDADWRRINDKSVVSP